VRRRTLFQGGPALVLIGPLKAFFTSLGTRFQAFARQATYAVALLHYLQNQGRAPIPVTQAASRELEETLVRQLSGPGPLQAGREPNAREDLAAALGLGLTPSWQRYEQLAAWPTVFLISRN